MENPQFERLLHEIAESRQHTGEVAATLREEMRQNAAETVALLRDEMRQGSAETVALLRDEMRQGNSETVALLRAEMRQGNAETVALLRGEMRQGNAETIALLRDEMQRSTTQTVAMLNDRIGSTAEESRRHFEVVAEGIRGDVRLLAESVVTLDAGRGRQLEELRRDMTTESAETRAMIKLSYVELDRRLTTLEATRTQ